MRIRMDCLAALALLTVAAGAPAQHRPADADDIRKQRPLHGAEIVPASISDADRLRVDPRIDVVGKRARDVWTGPIWAQAFAGDATSGARFAIASATVREVPKAGRMLTEVHYIADGTLSFGGRDFAIHADGFRKTAFSTSNALPSAVRAGIVDAAHHVAVVLEAGPGRGDEVYAALLHFVDLRRDGVISEGAFQNAKRELLGGG